MPIFWVRSMVASKTLEPAVVLAFPDGPQVQMRPEEARSLALNLLEGAEAAEQDAFIVDFAQKGMDLSLAQAGQLVALIRKYREEQWKKTGKGTPT